MSKEGTICIVFCLEENLTKLALANGVVLCVELVKSVESVAVLKYNRRESGRSSSARRFIAVCILVMTHKRFSSFEQC